MGKRVEYTPRSKIKAALRQLTLRSRERAAAMKRDKYTCVLCGKKQTKPKDKTKWIIVEAHHKKGILNWEEIYVAIYKYLLVSPEHWECLCKECHDLKERLP